MCRNKRLVEDERGKSSREVHPDQVLGGPGPCYDRACQPINASLHRFQRNHCPFTEGPTRAPSSRRQARTSTCTHQDVVNLFCSQFRLESVWPRLALARHKLPSILEALLSYVVALRSSHVPWQEFYGSLKDATAAPQTHLFADHGGFLI